MQSSTIQEFLTRHRVCCLTTLLKDGSPHAAALHYSHRPDPLALYFSTEKTSRKCAALLEGNSTRGSVVVGFSEDEWTTLQLDGDVQAIFDPDELRTVHMIHYAKHPDAEQYWDDPVTIFLKFTPSWWRHTNYNTDPETRISSDHAGAPN